MRVAVLIVNWNAGEALLACLESLFGCHPSLELEVVLVDNASTDDSAEAAQERFPQVRLVRNRENRGFAAAVNQAQTQAGAADYTLWLNPDTRFERDCLRPLIRFLEAHPEAAAAGPAVFGRDGRLQRGCRRREPAPWGMLCRSLALDRLFPASRVFAGHLYGHLPADRAQTVDSLSGSFMLIRRAALERVGGLDERFFLYAEDLDWCRRAREAGWKLYYFPEAQVLHLRAVSSSQRPFGRLWDLNFTALQYLRKHRPGRRNAPLRLALYPALLLRFTLGLPGAALTALRALVRKTKV